MIILTLLGIALIMFFGFFVPRTVANILLGCLLVSMGWSGAIWIIFGPLCVVTFAIDIAQSEK
jgi:hypothetical protein